MGAILARARAQPRSLCDDDNIITGREVRAILLRVNDSFSARVSVPPLERPGQDSVLMRGYLCLDMCECIAAHVSDYDTMARLRRALPSATCWSRINTHPFYTCQHRDAEGVLLHLYLRCIHACVHGIPAHATSCTCAQFNQEEQTQEAAYTHGTLWLRAALPSSSMLLEVLLRRDCCTVYRLLRLPGNILHDMNLKTALFTFYVRSDIDDDNDDDRDDAATTSQIFRAMRREYGQVATPWTPSAKKRHVLPHTPSDHVSADIILAVCLYLQQPSPRREAAVRAACRLLDVSSSVDEEDVLRILVSVSAWCDHYTLGNLFMLSMRRISRAFPCEQLLRAQGRTHAYNSTWLCKACASVHSHVSSCLFRLPRDVATRVRKEMSRLNNSSFYCTERYLWSKSP